tara:strand:- start:194 stop:409 length:216 start_codon:yes stop_codon:yes gene_type:complete
MEKTTESATSNVKSTETNISNDANLEKEVTLPTALPNVLSLVLLFMSTLVIIYAGYIHGHMSISAVYKNLQ